MTTLSYAQVKEANLEKPDMGFIENQIVKMQINRLWEMATRKVALNAYTKHDMRQLLQALVYQLS